MKSKKEAIVLSSQLNSAGIKLPANCKIQVMLSEKAFEEFIEEAFPQVVTDKKLKKSIHSQNGIEMTVNGIWFHFKTNQ